MKSKFDPFTDGEVKRAHSNLLLLAKRDPIAEPWVAKFAQELIDRDAHFYLETSREEIRNGWVVVLHPLPVALAEWLAQELPEFQTEIKSRVEAEKVEGK